MGELLEYVIGGGWGEELPGNDSVPVAIIRGADFPAVRRGDVSTLPLRYETTARANTRALREGDIVLEISGGTKGRPTGRTVYVHNRLLNDARATLIPASFCRLLRPVRDRVDPRYLYYWLQDMYAQGRTWSYQVQSTGLANFQMKLFLEREVVWIPSLDEQRRIAGVLGALDDLINTNRLQVSSLSALVNAQFERLFGQREFGLKVADLAIVVDCLHSKKPERNDEGPGLVLQLNNILDSGLLDLRDKFLIGNEDYQRWTKNLETRGWDCVITNVGRVGAVARIPVGVAAALGRNMTAIRPRQPQQDGAFLLASLLSSAVRQEIELRTDAGTILNALNVRSIPHLRLPEARSEERRAFQDFAGPLLTMADSLQLEILSLSRQRDELLPLLLSGRVRVGEVAA